MTATLNQLLPVDALVFALVFSRVGTMVMVLPAIGEVIGRSPSTICKWIHRIEAEQEEKSGRIGRSWHGRIRNERFKV